jgi:D-threo-aldose 1-dehydrogenase
LGLGCAGIFGLPRARDRREILEAAYDGGIRHFDVAPIYGLGRAEAELGRFVRSYGPDASVATKFGISISPFGRAAGYAQGPARRVLRSSARVKSKVKDSGGGPTSGLVGRVLYRGPDYSIANARASLHRSLRALKLDTVDVFLLHEPGLQFGAVRDDMCAYLESCRASGTIKRWGLAGDLSAIAGPVTQMTHRPDVLQYPYDLIAGHRGSVGGADSTITFGILSASLSAVDNLLHTDPQLRERCATLLGQNVNVRTTLAELLTRDALRNNPGGIVLVSTTNARHLTALIAGSIRPNPNDGAVLELLRAGLNRRGAKA